MTFLAKIFSDALKEFLLPYDEMRKSAAPDGALLEFLQSTYEAAATSGDWDRDSLERRTDYRMQSPQQ